MTDSHEHRPDTDRPKKVSKVQQTLKFLAVAAALQVILLVIIAFQLSNLGGVATNNDNADVPSIVPPTPSAPAQAVDMEALADDDAVKGDKNAPVTIIEFSDFECPFCARFYSQTYTQIYDKYIKTGKVKLIFRDFPLGFHQQAQKAAEAAECAGEQGKYYEMHDILFEQGVSGGVASFKAFAKQIGLNGGKFDTCLDSGAMAGEVRKDMADGQRAGIQGTPGFLINGKLVSGAQPFGVFEQIIEAELAN